MISGVEKDLSFTSTATSVFGDAKSFLASFFQSLRLVFKNRLVQAGAGILICFSLLAVGAPLLTTLHVLHEPIQQDLAGLDEDGMPLSPSGHYLLGTDNLGRDVLARVIYGARVSLTLGVASMLIATVIGVAIGLISGYYGGKSDMLLMRFTEMNMTIPSILLAIAFASLMDGRTLHLHPQSWNWPFLDIRLQRGMLSLLVLIGLVCWPGMVRVIRAQVLTVKEREFVYASRALGATDRRIIFAHVLPSVLPTVIVLAAMTTASTITLEAGLGYLGIGVPPPAPTWGSMIAEGQAYFIAAPILVIAPGLAIVITVLALNLLGQGLQEVLNPKLR
jgi:ABC-type dipeptide/oligopeptide/nickel transport system permease subunit